MLCVICTYRGSIIAEPVVPWDKMIMACFVHSCLESAVLIHSPASRKCHSNLASTPVAYMCYSAMAIGAVWSKKPSLKHLKAMFLARKICFSCSTDIK